MARIPDDEIERLKKEIPIERLVKGFGVELKPTGANLAGHCPFHEDQALAHRHPGHQTASQDACGDLSPTRKSRIDPNCQPQKQERPA